MGTSGYMDTDTVHWVILILVVIILFLILVPFRR